LVTAIAPEAVDFRLLDPQWLAVAAFVALPGLAVPSWWSSSSAGSPLT